MALTLSSAPGFAKFFKTHITKSVSVDSYRRTESTLSRSRHHPVGGRCGELELSSQVHLRDAMDV